MDLMDSAGVEWADLLPELLERISGRLEKHIDVVGFRSVCQSWRSSTLPLPQKLSPYFPYEPWYYNYKREVGYENDCIMYATGVYLVRPQSDPNKAWLAAVQEMSPGKLMFRNALTFQEIGDANYDLLDHSFTTQMVSRLYTMNLICGLCQRALCVERCVLVNQSQSASTTQFVVLSESYDSLIMFRIALELDGGLITEEACSVGRKFSHFVKFDGVIWGIDRRGRIFFLDDTNYKIVEYMSSIAEEDFYIHNAFVFVESDGDLYVVWVSRERDDCRIYKVSLEDKTVERVTDLGDRVFFIGCHEWSFSISGHYLPQPWKQGNCVVISGDVPSMCQCEVAESEDEHWVFNLGTQQFTKISALQDLFSPPRNTSSC